MTRTKIEYVLNPDGSYGYAWNIVSGCLNGPAVCPVMETCWARVMARRFKSHYAPSFLPAFHISRLQEPLRLKKPATIGVSFAGDFFGPGVHRHWQEQVLEIVRACPEHKFVFLTKAGEQLLSFQWPLNASVGVSITGALPDVDRRNLEALRKVDARVRWVSFEPLLAPWEGDLRNIQWAVIGAKSGSHARQPQVEWVGDIMEEAGRRGIPLWMKRNLSPPWPTEDLIQELPGANPEERGNGKQG